MNANQIEIICLCGDHIILYLDSWSKEFVGYCIECDKGWKLKGIRPKERKEQHGQST